MINQILQSNQNKKAQIAIFVIIAIAIVGAIVAVVVLRGKVAQQQGALPPEARDITAYIQYCVDQSLIDGTRLVGLQGGYITMPKDYISTDLNDVAYGYYQGKNTLPPKQTIEKEIGLYLDFAVPICFDTEKYLDLSLTVENIGSEVKINPGSVSATVNLPITLRKSDGTSTRIANAYESNIPIKLGEVYDFANSVVEKQVQEPQRVDITYLIDSKYNVLVIPYGSSISAYYIVDNSSKIDNIPFVFSFANKFT